MGLWSDWFPVFVHKVLLEHSHARTFMYCHGYFYATMTELSTVVACNTDHMACINLKYLLSGPMFANPCSKT